MDTSKSKRHSDVQSEKNHTKRVKREKEKDSENVGPSKKQAPPDKIREVVTPLFSKNSRVTKVFEKDSSATKLSKGDKLSSEQEKSGIPIAEELMHITMRKKRKSEVHKMEATSSSDQIPSAATISKKVHPGQSARPSILKPSQMKVKKEKTLMHAVKTSKKDGGRVTKRTKKCSIIPNIIIEAKGSGTKPNWDIVKRKSSELKKERRTKKLSNYETIFKVKKLWEEARREDCPLQQKTSLIATIHNLVEDELSKIVFAHDTSRIVQWLVKLGTMEIRHSICDTLQPMILEILQRKFSSHCVKELLKCGDQHCVTTVLNALKGSVVKCMTNNIAAPIVEYAYSNCATKQQKRTMELEFFGTSWKMITGRDVTSLKEMLSVSPEGTGNIIQETKDNILKAVNKEQTTSSLLHSVALEFLETCPGEREEVLLSLQPHVLNLIRTKAGARISMYCCWYLSKKMKKSIIKLLKGNVENVCCSDEGFWLILALLDAVDDTVLLRKVIIHEILNSLHNMINHEKGRKIVLYLVAHRDTMYFHPGDIALLKTADTSGTTFKNIATRRSEIITPTMEVILKCVSSEVPVWFKEPSIAMVLLAILKNGKGPALQDALRSVAVYITQDIIITDSSSSIPLIEHAGFSLVFKKLLKNDLTKEHEQDMFAYHLACAITQGNIKKWILCNRGCFLLAGIFETKNRATVNVLKEKFDEDIREMVHSSTSTGARVLYLLLSTSV